jgi:RNA polymerase-binding transcription factor DksA
MAKGRQKASYQHLLAHVTTLSAPARCLSGNALREWPIECLVPSMTATPSCGNELKRVQILLEAFATEREAIAIEQNPDQIDEIRTASDRDLAISKIDRQSKELSSVRGALRRVSMMVGSGSAKNARRILLPKRPWASLCIVCQEVEDRNPTIGNHLNNNATALNWSMVNAALFDEL